MNPIIVGEIKEGEPFYIAKTTSYKNADGTFMLAPSLDILCSTSEPDAGGILNYAFYKIYSAKKISNSNASTPDIIFAGDDAKETNRNYVMQQFKYKKVQAESSASVSANTSTSNLPVPGTTSLGGDTGGTLFEFSNADGKTRFKINFFKKLTGTTKEPAGSYLNGQEKSRSFNLKFSGTDTFIKKKDTIFSSTLYDMFLPNEETEFQTPYMFNAVVKNDGGGNAAGAKTLVSFGITTTATQLFFIPAKLYYKDAGNKTQAIENYSVMLTTCNYDKQTQDGKLIAPFDSLDGVCKPYRVPGFKFFATSDDANDGVVFQVCESGKFCGDNNCKGTCSKEHHICSYDGKTKKYGCVKAWNEIREESNPLHNPLVIGVLVFTGIIFLAVVGGVIYKATR
jgi:hypothetical protein